MKSAAWLLIGIGVASIAASLGAANGISVRVLVDIAIGAYFAFLGYALLSGRQDAWKQALFLSLGLGLIRALRALAIAYTSPWPIASAPAEIRNALAWNAGIAVAMWIAAALLLLAHRRHEMKAQ